MLLSSKEGLLQQTSHPLILTNCCASLNHINAVHCQQETTTYPRKEVLHFRACPSVHTASFPLPALPSGLVLDFAPHLCGLLHLSSLLQNFGHYLEFRVPTTVESQVVAGHAYNFINKIKMATNKGFCPLIATLRLRQLMGMTFYFCSNFHNDIQGQAQQPICHALVDISSLW